MEGKDGLGAAECKTVQGNGAQLYTWGLGKSGQLGTGKQETEHTPQMIKLVSGDGKKCTPVSKQVSCGGLFTAVLTEDGNLYTSGCGKYGRLATGNEEDKSTFIQVSIPEKIKQVASGSWHGAAVTVSGRVLVWGHRKGCGTAKEQTSSSTTLTSPTYLLSISDHKAAGVACGYNFTFAWTEEGQVLSWGSNHHGVLGHGSTTEITTPLLIEALKNKVIVQAAAGYSHSAFITADGSVYVCGKGKDGALGLGKANTTDATSPKLVTFPEEAQIIQVSCSVGEHHGHTLVLTKEGKVYAWGDGYKGKLGLGDQDSRFIPTLMDQSRFNSEQVSAVCAGGIHSTATTSEGNVFTWGCGSDGRMGHPEGQGHRYLFRCDFPKKVERFTAKSSYAAVSCSYYHTAAIVAR